MMKGGATAAAKPCDCGGACNGHHQNNNQGYNRDVYRPARQATPPFPPNQYSPPSMRHEPALAYPIAANPGRWNGSPYLARGYPPSMPIHPCPYTDHFRTLLWNRYVKPGEFNNGFGCWQCDAKLYLEMKDDQIARHTPSYVMSGDGRPVQDGLTDRRSSAAHLNPTDTTPDQTIEDFKNEKLRQFNAEE